MFCCVQPGACLAFWSFPPAGSHFYCFWAATSWSLSPSEQKHPPACWLLCEAKIWKSPGCSFRHKGHWETSCNTLIVVSMSHVTPPALAYWPALGFWTLYLNNVKAMFPNNRSFKCQSTFMSKVILIWFCDAYLACFVKLIKTWFIFKHTCWLRVLGMLLIPNSGGFYSADVNMW